jgi:hypothetical protein
MHNRISSADFGKLSARARAVGLSTSAYLRILVKQHLDAPTTLSISCAPAPAPVEEKKTRRRKAAS